MLDAARDMNYRPNLVARAMRTGKTKAIGVLPRSEPGKKRFKYLPAYEFFLGINDCLNAQGYMGLIRISDTRDGTHSRIFEEHVLDGIILLDVLSDKVTARVDEEFKDRCIWLDNNVWRDEGCVRRDELTVGRTLALAAAEKGYSSILWYSFDMETTEGGLQPHYSAQARYRGVISGAAEAGLEVREFTAQRREDAEGRSDELASLLAPDVAVIAQSPSYAAWTRDVMQTRGMLPGVHYGLACCDGDHFMEVIWPALTRMSYARYDMGYEAAAMLLGRLESPDKPCRSRLILPGEFEEGSTLAGPNSEG